MLHAGHAGGIRRAGAAGQPRIQAVALQACTAMQMRCISKATGRAGQQTVCSHGLHLMQPQHMEGSPLCPAWDPFPMIVPGHTPRSVMCLNVTSLRTKDQTSAADTLTWELCWQLIMQPFCCQNFAPPLPPIPSSPDQNSKRLLTGAACLLQHISRKNCARDSLPLLTQLLETHLIDLQAIAPPLPPMPASQTQEPEMAAPMETDDISDSEGLYADADPSNIPAGQAAGLSLPQLGAAPRPDAMLPGDPSASDLKSSHDYHVVCQASRRARSSARAPCVVSQIIFYCCLMAWRSFCAEHEKAGARSGAGDTSEEGFIEAGAQELQQLYADASLEMCRLLSQQRLVLVLDLDHTLVNSARQTEIDAEHLKVLSPSELESTVMHREPLPIWLSTLQLNQQYLGTLVISQLFRKPCLHAGICLNRQLFGPKYAWLSRQRQKTMPAA